MNLKNKLQFLRDHKIWKCMNKTEVLEEHSSSWMKNGLSSLCYRGRIFFHYLFFLIFFHLFHTHLNSCLLFLSFHFNIFNIFTELLSTVLSDVAVKVTVDVCLNKHWTDLVCGVDNSQLNESAASLKARFNEIPPQPKKRVRWKISNHTKIFQ